jgi:hypothetical protein
VVLCSELPPEIKVATETHAEVVFVGYFLKIYGYDAFKARRGAPMLVGRVRAVPTGEHIAASRSAGLISMLAIGGALIVLAIILAAVYRVTRRSRRAPLKPGPRVLSNENIESWLENIPNDEAGEVASSVSRFSTALAGNGKVHHPASPETNGHAEE